MLLIFQKDFFFL